MQQTVSCLVGALKASEMQKPHMTGVQMTAMQTFCFGMPCIVALLSMHDI